MTVKRANKIYIYKSVVIIRHPYLRINSYYRNSGDHDKK